jgi:putative ABC transport system permease protein
VGGGGGAAGRVAAIGACGAPADRRGLEGDMKYLPLVFAGLWRRPLRTVFTFLSILVAFILFGVMMAVESGFNHTLQTARLDRLFVDPRFGGTMPIAYLDRIASVPGVKIVSLRAGLYGYYQDPKNGLGIVMSGGKFFQVRPEFTTTPEQAAALERNPTGVIVTKYLSDLYHWKVGDRIPFKGSVPTKDGDLTWTFDVLAVVEDNDYPKIAPFMVANYRYLDERRTKDIGTADRFLVLIDDPARATEIGRRIDRMFANSPNPTRTESEKIQTQSGLGAIGDIIFMTRAIIGAVLFTLLCLIGNTLMQSVRERVPEFAVLKTLGFSDGGVLGLVIAESLLLCATAGMTGLILMTIGGINLPHWFPNVGVLFLITWPSFFIGLGFALLTGLIAAVIPARRVQKLNVVDALAGR